MNNEERESSSQNTVQSRQQGFVGRVIRKLIVLGVISIVGLFVLSMTAVRPDHIGFRNGRLALVPDSPNCVSSMTEKQDFFLEPISAVGVSDPKQQIKTLIADVFPRATLITEADNYLHYEFSSRIFRFVDDVEFLFDEQSDVIHFRSASRVGYSDLGANRKRMQRIRAEFGK